MHRTGEIILHLQRIEEITNEPGLLKHRLNPQAEEHILEEANTFKNSSHFIIKLLLPWGTNPRSEGVTETIHKHFAYLKERSERKLHKTRRLGWINLLIGLVMLSLLILVVIFIGNQLPEGGLLTTVREIFIILGWVIMWRPVEMLLYDWRPIKREVNLFSRLEQSKVEVLNE